MPSLDSSGDSRASIVQSSRFDSASWNPAEHKRLSRAVDFRNGYLHSHLHRIQTCEGFAPRFNCLCVETNQGTIRNVDVAQILSGGLAVVHRRPADEAETGERNDLTDSRFARVRCQLSAVSRLSHL